MALTVGPPRTLAPEGHERFNIGSPAAEELPEIMEPMIVEGDGRQALQVTGARDRSAMDTRAGDGRASNEREPVVPALSPEMQYLAGLILNQERSLGDKMSEQQRAVDQIRGEQTKLSQKSSALEQTIQKESKTTADKFAKME